MIYDWLKEMVLALAFVFLITLEAAGKGIWWVLKKLGALLMFCGALNLIPIGLYLYWSGTILWLWLHDDSHRISTGNWLAALSLMVMPLFFLYQNIQQKRVINAMAQANAQVRETRDMWQERVHDYLKATNPSPSPKSLAGSGIQVSSPTSAYRPQFKV